MIGDDLDFAFVELIPGIQPSYNERHPKPPTPEQVKLPTPPALPTPPPESAQAAGEGGTIPGAEGAPAADGTTAVSTGGEATAAATVEPEPEVPKGPPPPPPPFNYFLDLPAEGAEVPFVKNYEPPPPEPEPVAVREDGMPTCNFISSFASHHVGVVAGTPTEGAPAAATEVAPTAEATPAATETPAPPAETAPPADAPPTEAAPPS